MILHQQGSFHYLLATILAAPLVLKAVNTKLTLRSCRARRLDNSPEPAKNPSLSFTDVIIQSVYWENISLPSFTCQRESTASHLPPNATEWSTSQFTWYRCLPIQAAIIGMSTQKWDQWTYFQVYIRLQSHTSDICLLILCIGLQHIYLGKHSTGYNGTCWSELASKYIKSGYTVTKWCRLCKSGSLDIKWFTILGQRITHQNHSMKVTNTCVPGVFSSGVSFCSNRDEVCTQMKRWLIFAHKSTTDLQAHHILTPEFHRGSLVSPL